MCMDERQVPGEHSKVNNLNLNGEWDLYFHIEDSNLPETIEEVKIKKWDRIKANVPGNFEIDLCNAGIEEDPFYSENLYNYHKYEFYQWWFERYFTVPADFSGKLLDLVLKGLDTFGTIWVNGLMVGKTDNMLIEYTFDITHAVKIGEENHIAIRISSSINMVRYKEYPVKITGGGSLTDEMVWLRKPPHSFGWDIAPRLLSAGIWRDIEIKAKENTYLKEVYYATLWISEGKAQLLVKYRFSTDAFLIDDFVIKIKGVCKENTFQCEFKTNFVSGVRRIIIDNPLLWWPKGYGDQNLYHVSLELVHQGKVVEIRSEFIGIRLAEISTKYLPINENEFLIKINNVPILAKGTNWVPLDALHSRDKKRLTQVHEMLDDLGCNIVRCWGGNVYEDHEFFDLCDQKGILVWQDFALACGIYPQDDEFADMIEKEASFIVRKLRNHPSILLWAGDNEIDMVYLGNMHKYPNSRYNRISRQVLSEVISNNDPYRFFLPSSPYIPVEIQNDTDVPEQHCWGPRDYYKGDFYKNNTARFIGEIGYHGCPAVSSIRKFITPEKLWPYQNNDEWDTHSTDYIRIQKSYARNELMANQVKIFFGHEPGNLEEFAILSQISQAEALKFFIEMVRMGKWQRTGILWWNLIDCWPQFSDSIVDYYFNRKLAYFYVKRVQKQICIMVSEIENWERRVVLGNDGNINALVNYIVEDGETGNILLSGQQVSKANENVELGRIKAMEGEKRLYLIKWNINNESFGNHYISGQVPFDIERYKMWLKKIETLEEPFHSEKLFI